MPIASEYSASVSPHGNPERTWGPRTAVIGPEPFPAQDCSFLSRTTAVRSQAEHSRCACAASSPAELGTSASRRPEMTPTAAPIRPQTGYTTRMGPSRDRGADPGRLACFEPRPTTLCHRSATSSWLSPWPLPQGGINTSSGYQLMATISPRSDASHRSGPKTESDPFSRCAPPAPGRQTRVMSQARGA